MNPTTPDAPLGARAALRRKLLIDREAFVAGPEAAAAGARLARHLTDVLVALEPQVLGLYIPRRFEFNALPAIEADASLANLPKALPFSQRAPVRMHYRAWNGQPTRTLDDCGIASSEGEAVVPDVVLVPCIGYTTSGHRLGYGGGYFDRWLAAHPHVAAVGVAWGVGAIAPDGYTAEPHDVPMALIVTEHGTV